MLISEVLNMSDALTVRVDQEFSDMSMEFDFGEDWEDISLVPEKLKPLLYVITPTDQDYRGMASGSLKDQYDNSPEFCFHVGAQTGHLYMQDLLNDPQTVVVLNMRPAAMMKLAQAHVINEPVHDNMH